MLTTQEKKDKLYHIINYSFNSEALLDEALSDTSIRHKEPSYHNHNNNINNNKTNKRLRCLGNSVLNMVISEILFRKFPDEDEGLLTQKREALILERIKINVARRLNICHYLIVNSENGGICHPGAMSKGIEALIGALYIDGGLEVARSFISKYWQNLTNRQAIEPPIKENNDFKSMLQTWAHKNKQPLPSYTIQKETGPRHDPTFTVLVNIENFDSESGYGKTKKTAEQNAAKNLWNKVAGSGK